MGEGFGVQSCQSEKYIISLVPVQCMGHSHSLFGFESMLPDEFDL